MFIRMSKGVGLKPFGKSKAAQVAELPEEEFRKLAAKRVEAIRQRQRLAAARRSSSLSRPQPGQLIRLAVMSRGIRGPRPQ